jgi:ribulose-5-phosphate 4-epimerase/fuculose-1-phosphate aldolase
MTQKAETMFSPSVDSLMPELTPAEEVVLLARTLWREGYSDHLGGHITYNLGDGTLLCNPWLLLWNEIRPRDIIRIDLDGKVLEGAWPAPVGIPLHLELHKARPESVTVAMHNHPLYGTVWADMGEIPAAYDQSSSLGGGELVLVNEYEGGVNNREAARNVVDAMGDGDIALLRGHGVFVLGNSVRAVHQRAVALERRCQIAWHVRAAKGPMDSALPPSWIDMMKKRDGNEIVGFWEAMVRAELTADPMLLERELAMR